MAENTFNNQAIGATFGWPHFSMARRVSIAQLVEQLLTRVFLEFVDLFVDGISRGSFSGLLYGSTNLRQQLAHDLSSDLVARPFEIPENHLVDFDIHGAIE